MARHTDLARHALGLDGRRKVSYRNSFVCGKGHDDFEAWQEMVASGLAVRHDGRNLPFGGDDQFCVTQACARAVLRKGESLDPEARFPRPTTGKGR